MISTDLQRVIRDDQLGGITLLRLENGVRAARIRTLGGIDALAILDRCIDIAWCSFKGTPLVWHGPGALLPPHPGTINDDEFQRRFFGGLVTTCGLEAFGPSGSDQYGSWGEHGHINHIAAHDVQVRNEFMAPEPFMQLRGVISQVRMFGESLRLERSWHARLNGTTLTLRDRVTNEGPSAVPHMLLYHCNMGYPMLDEDMRVQIPHAKTVPRDGVARAGMGSWNEGGSPRADFREQVFIHTFNDECGDSSLATFSNSKIGRTVALEFPRRKLPVCFSWRMLGTRTYVMAVEPANCPTIQGRIAAAKDGTLPFLQPGETREYSLRFSFGETDAAFPME